MVQNAEHLAAQHSAGLGAGGIMGLSDHALQARWPGAARAPASVAYQRADERAGSAEKTRIAAAKAARTPDELLAIAVPVMDA
jgi:hypothetical protein